MTSKFLTQVEAEKATIDFFQARNAARGQYPQRINVKRTLSEVNSDGTILYTYTYKGETVQMLWGTYHTIVNFS
jgi:hypothetical protein